MNEVPQVPAFKVIKRHRTRALLNGIVIGLGIGLIQNDEIVVASIFVAIGFVMEYWHRKRVARSSE